MILIGPQICKWVKFDIFGLSYKLTSHDLWPSFVTFYLMNMWRFLHYINKPSLVPIGLPTFQMRWIFTFWAHLTTWPLMTFDLGLLHLTTWTYGGFHIWQVEQKPGGRGRGRKGATLGVHPLSWLLSNNRLEKEPFVSVPHTSSNRLLLSNQDKGYTLMLLILFLFLLAPHC